MGLNERETLPAKDVTMMYPIDLEEEVKDKAGEGNSKLTKLLQNTPLTQKIIRVDAKLLQNIGFDPRAELDDTIQNSLDQERNLRMNAISQEDRVESNNTAEVNGIAIYSAQEVLDLLDNVEAPTKVEKSFSPEFADGRSAGKFGKNKDRRKDQNTAAKNAKRKS